MNNKGLISQDDFLMMVEQGRVSISLGPIHFANGYFVEGTTSIGNKVYSTIRDGINRIMSYRTPEETKSNGEEN